MDSLGGTALGLDLTHIREIRIMAGRVIEIRLDQPMPHLLQLLGQPELGLLHKGKGAGPMRLSRDGTTALLTPINPQELGLPAIEKWSDRVRTLRLNSLPGEAAMQRFNRGEADLLLGGRIEDFPLTRSVGILRGTIKLDPVSGLFGLSVVSPRGFLGSPENREAIAMAIDREALVEPFGIGGWIATTRIVARGIEGDLGTIGERWEGQTLAQRRSQASGRVARWRQGGGNGATVRLRVALPEGKGSDILYAGLRRDLQAIGIETVRARAGGDADLRLVDEIARYSHPTWYLNRFSCAVRRGLCDKGADGLLEQAREAPDGGSRAALLAEAEAELTAANVFIPFGAPIRWSLVRGDVIGFAANRWGWHPLMPMALLPK
jgi:hypothetical protein